MSPASHPQDESKYSRAGNVRARFGGVSDMWLTRRMRDDGFPQPVYFGTKERFWKDEELDAWERLMIQRGLKETNRAKPPSRKLTDARRRATEDGLVAERAKP